MILVLIPGITGAFTYNSKEFQSIIHQLDMQGHADHELSTCSVKKVYYDEVIEMLNGGKDQDEIIDFYVGEYGQAALRKPGTDKNGLVAWTMPAVGLLIGIVIVTVWIKKLTAKKAEMKEAAATDAWENEAERDIIEKTFEEERRKLF